MMEDNFTPELIKKARQAKSSEELLALAKENGIVLSEDEAKEYFEQFNKTGELSDDELDNVSGGGCQTKVNGKSYTIVTCYCKCFTGRYEPNNGRRTDHSNLRKIWSEDGMTGRLCGDCVHLGFKVATGYCEMSAK
ncbi:MAG: Nif11-like leader peptide family RiPP precursor [Oscillospiraceae bacterium]|nr:Nif11-like leader peptide family RiPP precursor [Oscillospiraceae bacterium]